MTEDLIRSVVQQVLSQMGGRRAADQRGRAARPSGQSASIRRPTPPWPPPRRPSRPSARRPLDDRRKAVEAIRTICVEQAEELGRMELDETKIGRLDHKIAKLRDADPARPGRRVPPDRQRLAATTA